MHLVWIMLHSLCHFIVVEVYSVQFRYTCPLLFDFSPNISHSRWTYALSVDVNDDGNSSSMQQHNTIQCSNSGSIQQGQYNTMQCSAKQCNAMQCNAMQCNAMQCNAMQCNAMQCNAMQCNAMQCNTDAETSSTLNSPGNPKLDSLIENFYWGMVPKSSENPSSLLLQ